MRTWCVSAIVGVFTCVGTSALGAELTTILLPEAEEIQLALEAGPEAIRDAAAVYVFGMNGYRQVRSGSNGFTCLVNRDGNQNGDNDLKPTCWDPEGTQTIVPVMLRVGQLIAQSASAAAIKQDIDSGFASGKFIAPRKAGIAYMLRGDNIYDPQSKRITQVAFPPHYMVYAPGVTRADIASSAPTVPGLYAMPAVYSGYSGAPHTTYIIIQAASAFAAPPTSGQTTVQHQH